MMEHLRSGPAQPGDDMGHGFELKGESISGSCSRVCWPGKVKARGSRELCPWGSFLPCYSCVILTCPARWLRLFLRHRRLRVHGPHRRQRSEKARREDHVHGWFSSGIPSFRHRYRERHRETRFHRSLRAPGTLVVVSSANSSCLLRARGTTGSFSLQPACRVDATAAMGCKSVRRRPALHLGVRSS